MDIKDIFFKRKTKLYPFPKEILIKICKEACSSVPIYLYLIYYGNNVLKGIQDNSFEGLNTPYDLVQFYIDELKFFIEFNFFKESRYYANFLITSVHFDSYINLLFFVKLYLYYLKVKIRKIMVLKIHGIKNIRWMFIKRIKILFTL